MKLALELSSQEAYLGMGLGAIVFIAYLLLRGGDSERDTNNIVNVQGSPGAQVSIDRSKHTRIDVTVKTSIQRAPPPPSPAPAVTPRTSSPGSGSSSGDDVMAVAIAALFALTVVGLFYLRNFEAVTYWSRLICFASGTCAFLYGGWDIADRGIRWDQIQWSCLFVLLISLGSASLLLQSQDLISADWVQAAVAQQKGAVDFFLNRLPRDGWKFVMASLLCTMAVVFVSIAALAALLRTLVLSLQDEASSGWLTRKFIDAAEWLSPGRFAFISALTLGFAAFILYYWLPQSLQRIGP